MSKIKILTIPSVGKNMDQVKVSYTTGENVQGDMHFGKH